MSTEEKPPVEVEAPPKPVTLAPSGGVQDMNAPMQPDEAFDLGGPIERVLTDEVHVDMGRGPLTFKPGDKLTIQDGSIRKVTTREGMEMEFTPAHEVYAEQRASDVAAQLQHQNLSAGQPDALASPAPRVAETLQVTPSGAFVETEEAQQQPGRVIGEGGVAEDDTIPVAADELPAANPADPPVPAAGSPMPTTAGYEAQAAPAPETSQEAADGVAAVPAAEQPTQPLTPEPDPDNDDDDERP